MTPRSAARPPKPVRLDVELVRRGLVESREQARRAIEEGRVMVRGMPATRASSRVSADDAIALRRDAEAFVSRGGSKLDGALRRLEVTVAGRRWLDVGASTGGFTDRLLQGGAAAVAAVDVGYGQLDWRLRNDERVVVLERTNARSLSREQLPWPADGVVADVSFISLELLLPALASVAASDADFVLLVKPQFEVGREAVGKGGVVRDPELWRAAIARVVAAAERSGLGLVATVPSEVVGPAGNREFFVHLRRGAPTDRASIDGAVAEVAS